MNKQLILVLLNQRNKQNCPHILRRQRQYLQRMIRLSLDHPEIGIVSTGCRYANRRPKLE